MESQIHDLHKQLASKKISCVALVTQKLNALKANMHNTSNNILNDLALSLAAQVDNKISRGETIGLLEGIPFGIKDVIMLQGTKATASSNILKNYTSAYTATAIEKLLNAGAIPVVKENCDSFGHGSSSENTIFGAVKNALNSTLVGGGSSGGSAVNVAKGHTVFSIGGDTGGSIRQPAGYNKIYGFKPTYGRVSRFGIMAYASSTDCVGPIASNLEDIRIVLNTISGKDVKDQTTYASEDILLENNKLNTVKTVGYFKNFVDSPAINPKIKSDFLASLEKIKAKGITLVPLDFFDGDVLVSTYYTIAMAETASNLSRLDGTNYGNRIEHSNLKESYAITRSEHFSEESKRRIVGGNQVLSQGFSDAIYLKSLAIRDTISKLFETNFKTVDIIVSPVTPNPPPAIGNSLKDPHAMYLSDAYTVGFSLGHLPTLTLPKGTETGIQITAAKQNDALVLAFANYLNTVL